MHNNIAATDVLEPDAPTARPTLRELEVLRAVIATRKTTAAAHRLGLSQPAVSRAVTQLEARLSCELFRREGGRLVPTAHALALDQEIEPILAALARLEHWPRADAGQALLRLAAPPTLAHDFLPPLLTRFLAAENDTAIQMEIGTTTDVVNGVADGRFDVGLTDTTSGHAGVRLEPFRRSQAHVVLPAEHPLAARATLGPHDLHELPFIALTRRFAVRAIFDRLFLDVGAAPRIVVETATSASAFQLVREGVGISLLNPFPLALKDDPSIIFRPFLPQVTYETAFVVPSLASLPACGRRFIEFLRAHQPEDCFSTPIR